MLLFPTIISENYIEGEEIKEYYMRNKILIVDDVEMNRELLAEMLKDDYEIEMAQNGKGALRILA